MENMLDKINETADYLKQRTGASPSVGIILGTGLGGLVKEIEVEHEVPYEEIPNFPVSTVEGHSGKLFLENSGVNRSWLCKVVSITTRATV
jgi:purine-nucleoside phosphorylase